MEADLARFYTIDYSDRFRRKRNGRLKLTLRRLCVLIRHLPPESTCASILRDDKPHWSLEAHLLDDLRMVQVGTKKNPAKPHPLRPTGKQAADPKRGLKLAQARSRKQKRDAAIAAGEIT